MNVRDAIARRRTPVRFEPDGLLMPREDVEALILEACRAPSEDDLQPWRFLIVRDRARRETLYECAYRDPRMREAAVVVVVCGDTRAYAKAGPLLERWIAEGAVTQAEASALESSWRDLYARDAWARVLLALRGPCFVAMNLMLLAMEQGIGVAPIFHFDEAALRSGFHLSEDVVPILLLTLGLPSTRHAPAVDRPRAAASDIIRHEDMESREF